ncbi:MAG: hypothetical protein ABTQ34_00325 [Bdellovibrionales bacterium]
MTFVSAARSASAGNSNILGDIVWQPMDHRLWPVIERLAGGQYELLSCDFFDTLLWRITSHPHDVFPYVFHKLREQGLLAPHATIQAFDAARRLADSSARSELTIGCDIIEVTIEEIYRKFPCHFVTDVSAKQLAAVEEAVEYELLRRDSSFVRLIEWTRSRSIPFVVVSDTFYSSEALRRMMQAAGWPAHLMPERFFVSSETRRGKTRGLLGHMAAELRVDPAKILHVGDNPDADVIGPSMSGMSGILIERIPVVVRELEGIEPRREIRLRGASLAEHADYAIPALRRQLAFESEIRCPSVDLRPYWTYGALVFGPAMAAFAHWMRLRTSELGARKIHCLQREGEIFYRLLNRLEKASPMLAQGGAPVQPVSLPASRIAIMRCAVDGSDPDSLKAFAGGLSVGATVADFLDYLGLRDMSMGMFGEMGKLLVISTNLQELEWLYKYIAGSERLRSQVNELALRRCERFAQLAFGDNWRAPSDEPFVLADLGYGGTMQRLIVSIFKRLGLERKVFGLYFVTNSAMASAQAKGCGPSLGYLADHGQPLEFVAIDLRSHPILEQCLMPDMGSVKDYAEGGPVRQPVMISRQQQAQQNAVQEGMSACTEVWPRLCQEIGISFDVDDEKMKDRLRSITARALGEPTAQEIQIFSSWMYETSLGSSIALPLIGDVENQALMRYVQLVNNLQDPDLWLYAKLRKADADLHARFVDMVRATGQYRNVPILSHGMVVADFFALAELAKGEQNPFVAAQAHSDLGSRLDEAGCITLEGGRNVPIPANEKCLLVARCIFSTPLPRRFRSIVVRIAPTDALVRIDGAELLWSSDYSVRQSIYQYRHLAQGRHIVAASQSGLDVEGGKPVSGNLYVGRRGLTVRIAVPESAGQVCCVCIGLHAGLVSDRELGFERAAAHHRTTKDGNLPASLQGDVSHSSTVKLTSL